MRPRPRLAPAQRILALHHAKKDLSPDLFEFLHLHVAVCTLTTTAHKQLIGCHNRQVAGQEGVDLKDRAHEVGQVGEKPL